METEKAKEILEELLKKMGIDTGVSAKEIEDYISLEITTPDSALVIGRQGKTLGALQYLVNLIVNKGKEERIKVILDTEGYRERRKARLMELAEKLAQRAKEENTEIFLEPMNPYERRIIHTTLAGDPDVETESVGEGMERQVVISPKKKE
ncbi:KH domain-containing protein [bacterium]|nr:KH domain-containing protein [bacterium]MCG2676354.1 KH domain-containing protein [bacterium]MCG2677905.1 KH domain-containing protein [bacterium]